MERICLIIHIKMQCCNDKNRINDFAQIILLNIKMPATLWGLGLIIYRQLKYMIMFNLFSTRLLPIILKFMKINMTPFQSVRNGDKTNY